MRVCLITPEPPGPQLTETREDQPYPIIAEGESSFDAIAGKVGRIGDIAAETLENINSILTADNRAAITASLVNLKELTAGLNQRVKDLDKTLAAVNAAAEMWARGNNLRKSPKDRSQLAPAIKQVDQRCRRFDAALALENQSHAARTLPTCLIDCERSRGISNCGHGEQ